MEGREGTGTAGSIGRGLVLVPRSAQMHPGRTAVRPRTCRRPTRDVKRCTDAGKRDRLDAPPQKPGLLPREKHRDRFIFEQAG